MLSAIHKKMLGVVFPSFSLEEEIYDIITGLRSSACSSGNWILSLRVVRFEKSPAGPIPAKVTLIQSHRPSFHAGASSETTPGSGAAISQGGRTVRLRWLLQLEPGP